MLISDLPYLENISKKDSAFGGVLLALTAFASAFGANALASTSTNISLRTRGQFTIARGKATALAIGSDPIAAVGVYFEGFDKVIIKTKSRTKVDYAFQTIKVRAIDFPN